MLAELLIMSESILAGYTFKLHPVSKIVPLENNYLADLENVFLVMKCASNIAESNFQHCNFLP